MEGKPEKIGLSAECGFPTRLDRAVGSPLGLLDMSDARVDWWSHVETGPEWAGTVRRRRDGEGKEASDL